MFQKPEKPHLSLVIPVLNEEKNIFPVFKEISALRDAFPPFEILVVDDGSQDNSLAHLKKARQLYALPMRIFKHSVSLGKSASLQTAILQSHATWIATMDSDGQDNPAFIPILLKKAEQLSEQGFLPLIVAARKKRCDNLSRRLATKIANSIRSFFLKDNCIDTAAPIKIFPKSFFLTLPQFEGVHRFLPAFMKMRGGRIEMIEIAHRPRLYGHSKYTNFSRAFLGVFDLLGVHWLRQRYRDNTHFIEY